MVDLGKAARNSTAGNSTAANNSNATLPFGGGTAIQARIVTRSGDRGLRLPGQAVNATLQNVPGAKYILGKGWVLPCNALDNVDIRLNVGGNEYPINGQDLMDDNAHNIQTAEGKLPSSEYCTVGLYEATS